MTYQTPAIARPADCMPDVISTTNEYTACCFEHNVNLIQPRANNRFDAFEKHQPVSECKFGQRLTYNFLSPHFLTHGQRDSRGQNLR